jgi:hypothetical protein
MVKCARKIPEWDVRFAERSTCSKQAALFMRTMNGKLRPLCRECLDNSFDDVAKRVSIEDGWDEWLVQETMSS